MTRATTRLKIEPLETRTLLATCTVNTLADTGSGIDWTGDLRYCINKVNAEPGADVIGFTVTGTINLTGVLPDLASDIDIQGPGANQLTVRRDTGGTYRIFKVTSAATIQMAGLTITNGSPNGGADKDSWGGGIYSSGDLTITAVAVTHNVSTGVITFARGGGIYSEASLTVVDSTIAFNSVSANTSTGSARGGGTYSKAAVTFRNSTIAHNGVSAGCTAQSHAWGGGIDKESALFMSHSTISANTSNCSSGGINGSVSSIEHSIVSGNVGGSNPDCSCSGAFNIIGGNAMLGPLQNNGGPTDTMALLPGSPAIDTGSNAGAPQWDQRGPGYPRIVNDTIDIGAFEVQIAVTNTNDSGLGSLRQAILDTNAHPGLDTITFAIDSGPQTIAPMSPLPAVTDPLTIDGTTQPGYAGGPVIELWGGHLSGAVDGLAIAAADSTIKALAINLFPDNGVVITGNNNRIELSLIGVDLSGTVGVPNGGNGVEITGANNTVGGAGTGNLIAFNGGHGVLVDTGDGNAIQKNSIHSNTGLGIDLTSGGNNDQRAPSVNSAVSGGGTTTIAASLALVAPNTTYTIEFFSGAVCDPSTFGEGESFLGAKTLTTTVTGRGRTIFVVGFEVPVGHVITATATSPGNDTSEFSKCRTVTAGAGPGGGGRGERNPTAHIRPPVGAATVRERSPVGAATVRERLPHPLAHARGSEQEFADQRGPGFPRIVNGTIDIGSFEVQATGAPTFSRPRQHSRVAPLYLLLAIADNGSVI